MEELGLTIKFGSIGEAALIQASANTKQHLIKDVQDIGAAHVRMFNERLRIEAEISARLKQSATIQAATIKTNGAIEVATIKANAAASLAAKKEGFAREVAAAKAAAREEAAARNSASRSFKIGIGAVAGQGFSVGGIASVNPYAAAGLAAAYAVKNVATDLVAEATVWEKFKVALTDIEGSAVKASEATNNLYELAKRPGIGLKEAEQTYIQFRALNMEGAKAQRTIAAISNAVALSGGGATEFQRVNYQITQMLSKGKVLEEDLRIMRNSLPRLTVAMRDAFGTTTAEGIRKAGVNAEDFLAKIVTQFEKLPQATQTLESAQENAATAMSRLKAALVPDSAVKSGIETWTSLLENLTSAIGAVKHPIATTSSAWEDFKKTLTVAGGISAKDLQTAKNGESKYGDVGLTTYGILNMSANEGDRAKSFAAYNEGLQKASEAKAKLEKEVADSVKDINLENEKLKIQLRDISEYEKQRLIIIAEYKYKINDANTEEAKAALLTQRNLQLKLLLANKNKEDLKTQEKITEELEKQTQAEQKQANDAFENANGISYAAYRLANPSGVDNEFDRTKSRTKSMQESDAKTIQEQADAWQKSVDKGNELSMQYAPELDKLRMEYEKQRQAVVEATFRTGEERNRVMKALNDQYLRDQAEMLAKSATAVTSAGQSLFSDLAGAMKMRSDYEYNIKKASIEKQLSLTGLEGEARVAQQRRRDEALEALDEKRQKDLQGSYLTMFMIAKGFALAESAIKLNLAIANAAASGPFPANLAAMAAVAAAVGSVVTNIAEINYAGAFDKGGNIPSGSWGIAGEYGPEIVQGPARVTSRAETAKLLGNGSGVSVTVLNYSGKDVKVEQEDDGNKLRIIIGEVSKQVESQLSTAVRSGRGEFASAVKETFGLNRQGS